MTTQSLTPPITSPFDLAAFWRTSRALTLLGLGSLGLLAVTLVLALIDPRMITGAPAWIKPMKFAISTVVYAFTLVWMMSFVIGHPRLKAFINGVTMFSMVVELVLIVMQVMRGVRSHFNFTTPFDGVVFSTMGNFIVIVWIMNLLTTILLVRQKMPDGAFAWSLRLGLLIMLYGALVAFAMTSPNSDQMAVMQTGTMPDYMGAHSVGVPDGGASLPFVGWSTEGGDLRIPHFFGLHALQVVPLLGFLVNRLFAALHGARRTALVWTGGLGYFGFVLLLTWQALRGQSIVAPDALTLGALGALVVVVALVGGAIALTARKATSAQVVA